VSYGDVKPRPARRDSATVAGSETLQKSVNGVVLSTFQPSPSLRSRASIKMADLEWNHLVKIWGPLASDFSISVPATIVSSFAVAR